MKSLLFIYLMTAIGTAAGIFYPFVGLLVYIGLALLKPDSLWPSTVPQGSYSRMVGIAILLGWAARGFGDWRLGPARGIVYALIAFLGWASLLVLTDQQQGPGMVYLEAMTKIVLPFLVGITVIESRVQLRLIAWVIMISLGYIALEMELSTRNGFNRPRYGEFGGLDNNGIAILMDTGIGLAIFLGLGSRAWWQRGLALAATVLMVQVVLLSNSRGGMVALGCISLIAFLLLPKTPTNCLVFAALLALGLAMAGEPVKKRFRTIFAEKHERDASYNDRLRLLEYSFDSIARRPIFGVGPDRWSETARREYRIPRSKATEAHNTWVQITAELGLPGLALILSFYGLCIFRMLPIARGDPGGPGLGDGDLARGVIVSVLGFILSGAFVSCEAVEAPYYLTLIGAGLLKLRSSPDGEPIDSLRPWNH